MSIDLEKVSGGLFQQVEGANGEKINRWIIRTDKDGNINPDDAKELKEFGASGAAEFDMGTIDQTLGGKNG